MNIVVITRHAGLAERVKTAFEEAGHHVLLVPDPLQALATEAWKDAHLLLVDADGEPLDGIRFSALLRGESRPLFRNLPILLIHDAPGPAPHQLLDADVDGHLSAHDDLARIRTVLGPALEGYPTLREMRRVPLLATGFTRRQGARIGDVAEHCGFALATCPRGELLARLAAAPVPVLLLNLDPAGHRALGLLQELRERPDSPYVILAGRLPGEAQQRKLTLGGIMDWIPVPLSAPLLLHALRRAVAWRHLERLQREFQSGLAGMHERWQWLEMEASSLRNEALTDPLTELLNRRAFNRHLEQALSQWERHHRPFVLVFGDIDYFKLINDRFGHFVGDQVLKLLAERIRSSLRRSDLAFRIGGEEFAIILTETTLQAGAEVADKLRRRIDENPIHLETGQTIFPTISFGVGAPERHDFDALCRVVDEALYLAKHKGRNRIELATELPRRP